jgi:hypothetical protein
MNFNEMEEKIKTLEAKVKELEDIEQIKIVQKSYGYYMDNLMYDDAADLFTDDCHAFHIDGREALKVSFNTFTTDRFEGTKKLFLKQQLMGVIHVDKEGKTAKGRWNMLCLKTDYVGDDLESIISHGVYECEYRKEDGIWKISTLVFNSSFQTTLKDGWAAKPVIYPKSPGDVAKTWASGYKMPLHYKNPVTGK